MLQIIRGKLVIFLITLCLFVVYLGYFMDIKHQRALRYIFLKKILFIK